MFASVAPQQGHLVTSNSSKKRRPADMNSDAGIILNESTGFALKKAVAPGSDWLMAHATVEVHHVTMLQSFLRLLA